MPVSSSLSPVLTRPFFPLRYGWLCLMLLLLPAAAHAQAPLYTGVLVSDVGSGNNIGEANTSRNLAVDAGGTIYVVFSGSQGIRVAKSTNRGQSFLPSVRVSTDNAEPEIALGDNGDIYVVWGDASSNIRLSRSTNGGASFSSPALIGTSSFGVPHMAVKGNKVYIVRQNGSALYYNRNYGIGAFQMTSLVSSYVYADVRIREDGVVFIPTDDPFLRLFRSVDSGATITQVPLNPGGNVYYSSYTLSGGGLGNFIFTGGGGIVPSDTAGYRYDLSNGSTTQLRFGLNPTAQGRTLFADDYGDLIDGYRSSFGGLYFNISYNQGQNFQSPILVANGLSHNLGVNHVYEDVVIAYEAGGQVYLAVYPDLIKRVTITSQVPTALCPGNTFTINYTLFGAYGAGNVVTAQLSDAGGNFNAPVNIGSVTSSVSGSLTVTIPAGTPFGTGYRIRLVTGNPILYSKNNGTDITIGAVVPSVAVSHLPPDTVCPGIPVTFVATPVNGGISPLFQFKKNGINVGPNSASNTYTDATLLSSDVISVVMTTTSTCGGTTTVTSGTSRIFVRAGIVPSVALAASTAGPICSGTPVTFTATPTNGGPGPLYQFRKNGSNVGPNSASVTYTDATLTAGDIITVVMTANNSCQSSPTATSNALGIPVNPTVSPAVSVTANPGDTICAGVSVTFTAAPANGGTAPAYQWRKNGIAVGGNSPLYTDAGLVTGDRITVRLTSNMVCRTRDTAVSNIITMRVATAAAPPAQPGPITGATRVCAGTPQTYSVSPSSGATGYTWSLPAGWSGASATAAINATAATTTGTGIITVTAQNDCGSSAPRTLADTVITLPGQPGAISGNASVCASTLQAYSIAAVPGATSYNWTVPSGWGSPSSSDTMMSTTAAAVFGSGNITVTAVNACGASAPATLPVTAVTVIPAQPGTISGNVNVCGGTAQPYSIPGIAQATSYVWTLPQSSWTAAGATGTTAITTVPDLSAIAGTVGGTLRVVATNGCGSSAPASVVVTVTNIPGTPGTVSGPDSLCAGLSGSFSIGAVNEATSYTWTLPAGGWSGASTTRTLNGNTAATMPTGTYTITVAGSNTCGTGPAAVKTVRVTQPVTPSVLLNPGTPVLCSGQPLSFTAVTTGGGTVPLYQWRINGQPSGNPTTNPVFTSTSLNNGDKVSVLLNSNAVCATPPSALSSEFTVQLTQTVTPGVNINASQPAATLCAGTPVTFTATPITGAGTAPSYQWRKNNVIVGTNSAVYTDPALNSNDTVSVIMTSSFACVTTATALSNKIGMKVWPVVSSSVTISASPGVMVSAGTMVTFTAQATNAGANPRWQWLKNGRAIAGANSAIYATSSLRNGDVISAQLTPDQVCVSGSGQAVSNPLTILIDTDVPHTGGLSGELSLFPNPNDGHFTVRVTGGTAGRQVRLEVLGMLGQVVSSTAVTPGAADWSVDMQLGGAAAGMYMLRLSDALNSRSILIRRFELIR